MSLQLWVWLIISDSIWALFWWLLFPIQAWWLLSTLMSVSSRILYIWKRHHNLLKCNNARGAVSELILNILKAFRKIFSVLLVIVTNVRKMSRTMTWTRPEIKIIEKDVKNYWGDLEEVMRQAVKLHGWLEENAAFF